MKKFLACILAVMMIASVMAIVVAADTEIEANDAKFTLYSASAIEFTNNGEEKSTDASNPSHSASYSLRGGAASLDVLTDGDLLATATQHSTKGVVLVLNDYTSPAYNLSSSNAHETIAEAATYSFTVVYDDKVSFDTAVLGLFHQIGACVSIPGGGEVLIEYSETGATWNKVGRDGMFYYTTSMKDYSDSAEPGMVDVVTIPLGKSISASQVRFTFSFMDYNLVNSDEAAYWRWYCDVLEWTGFTELGVAKYESGSKPATVTKAKALEALDNSPKLEEGKLPDKPEVELTLGSVNTSITTDQSTLITDPSKHADYNTKYCALLLLAPVDGEKNTYYVAEKFDCNGTDAVFSTKLEKGMIAAAFHGDTGGDGYDRKQAALNLEIGTKLHLFGVSVLLGERTYSNSMLYTIAGEERVITEPDDPSVDPSEDPGNTSGEEPVDPSSETPSEEPVDPSSEAPSETPSEEPSEAPSEDATESSTAPAEESATSTPADDNGGLSTGAIIGIIAAVVVVIGIVAFVIIKKKKA